MDSESILQIILKNQESSLEVGIIWVLKLPSNVVCVLYKPGKSIRSCWIVLHVNKILQNFWLYVVYQYSF